MTGPEFGVLIFLLLLATVLAAIFLTDRERNRDGYVPPTVDNYFTFQWWDDDD